MRVFFAAAAGLAVITAAFSAAARSGRLADEGWIFGGLAIALGWVVTVLIGVVSLIAHTLRRRTARSAPS